MGQHSSPKGPATGPDVYRLLLKEDGMLHSCKHGPVPTYFKHITVINPR